MRIIATRKCAIGFMILDFVHVRGFYATVFCYRPAICCANWIPPFGGMTLSVYNFTNHKSEIKKCGGAAFFYIMPGMPPPIAGADGFSSGISVITAPVVNITPAVLAAAIMAVFTTLAGSIMPAAIISVYSPVCAS